MSDLTNTENEARRIEALAGDDEQQPEVESQPMPIAKPGRMWRNAAARRGLEDEYDNMMRDKYGEGW
jgi:hypothetical protein